MPDIASVKTRVRLAGADAEPLCLFLAVRRRCGRQENGQQQCRFQDASHRIQG